MNVQLELKIWLKLQNKLWLTGYIATLLLPFGLIFNRGITEVCVILISVLFLVNSFCNKKWEWIHNPAIKIGFAIWAWLIFISLFAQNTFNSLDVSIPWIRYILLYAALQNWILTKSENIYFLVKTLVFMLCFVIIDTLWQYVFGISITEHIREESGRLTGPMDNVKVGIFLTKMLFPTIGIYLFFSHIRKNYTKIISSLILLVVTIATILVSGERTAFASTMIAFCAISFLLIITEKKFRKITIFVAVITIAESVFLFQTQSSVHDRSNQFYNTVSNYSNSEYGQLQKAGFIIGKENWLTGAGLKGFRSLCPNLLNENVITACNLHPHNLYVEWFAETGIVGLLLFISLVFYWILTVAKSFIEQSENNRLLSVFIMACIIVNLFPFMPTQSVFSNWPAILLWYSVSVAIASLNVLKPKNT